MFICQSNLADRLPKSLSVFFHEASWIRPPEDKSTIIQHEMGEYKPKCNENCSPPSDISSFYSFEYLIRLQL